MEVQKAEYESALGRQKAEFEEKLQAEVDATYAEGARAVTVEYKARVHKIRQRAWELRWRAGLRKAGVSEDDPDIRNPPEFHSSDPGWSSAPSLSSEVPPGVDAAYIWVKVLSTFLLSGGRWG